MAKIYFGHALITDFKLLYLPTYSNKTAASSLGKYLITSLVM